ncbi:MAG: HPr family phosphocarrier protein [Kiloniellaceae bacterium]
MKEDIQDSAIDPVRRRLTICNQKGLHARAAAKFVKLAETFDAQITVVKSDTRVSGSSIMGLMMLAAGPGCEIDVEATGASALEAVDALARLVARKFDEDG